MAKSRTETTVVFIHDTQTHARMDIGRRTINTWALDDGIYSDAGPTGFHYIIRRSGLIELGRDLAAHGQHILGWNTESIGICLVGGADIKKRPEENYTEQQDESLMKTVTWLLRVYPNVVLAPCHAGGKRPAPGLDVWAWQLKHFGASDELRFLKVREEHDAT